MAYELIQSTYLNQNYTGHAERCTWEFSIPAPEQLAQWPADQFIAAHIEALATQNARLLELKVYRDIEPDFTTNYRIVTLATASPLWWNLIIVGVLALAISVVYAYAIITTEDLPFYMSSGLWALAIGTVAVATIVVAKEIGASRALT
jgi:hypothetical protein